MLYSQERYRSFFTSWFFLFITKALLLINCINISHSLQKLNNIAFTLCRIFSIFLVKVNKIIIKVSKEKDIFSRLYLITALWKFGNIQFLTMFRTLIFHEIIYYEMLQFAKFFFFRKIIRCFNERFSVISNYVLSWKNSFVKNISFRYLYSRNIFTGKQNIP